MWLYFGFGFTNLNLGRVCNLNPQTIQFKIYLYKFKFLKRGRKRQKRVISAWLRNLSTRGREKDSARFSEHKKSAQMPISQAVRGHLRTYDTDSNLERKSMKNEENEVLQKFSIGSFASLKTLAARIRLADFG